MKVLVTGVAGQLGHDVVNELASRGHEPIGTDLKEVYSGIMDDTYVTKAPYVSLDITDSQKVSECIMDLRPDAVIHCAAWTAVDAAEDEENRETVRRVNVSGTDNIAKACKECDAKMLYLSTDYVFDGMGETPWDPDDKNYAPLNVYGKSKLDGELSVAGNLEKYFIVRIAWVFGRNGNNFIKTMLRLGKTHDKLTVVSDQIGTPTYTYDLARLLADMIETDKYGYYHATNEGGYISWYDFAVEAFKMAAAKGYEYYDDTHLEVKPVTTAEYGVSKAARPFNSRLDRSKLKKMGFEPLPGWRDALGRYIDDLDIDSL